MRKLNGGFLSGYYPLNSDALDFSGRGNNGTLFNTPTFQTGKVSNAINFGTDATPRSVNIVDNNNDFSFTDNNGDIPFTIMTWVYFSSYSITGNWLINKRSNPVLQGRSEWQLIRTSSTNSIRFFLYDALSTTSNPNYLEKTFPLSILNTWVHLAVTYDRSATLAGIKMFLNGVQQTTTDTSVGTYNGLVKNGSNDVVMGLQGWVSGGGQDSLKHRGLLDETYIWKGIEQTPAFILDAYNTGLAGNPLTI